VIYAVYEPIVLEGPRFVGLRLTPAAYRHGLPLALRLSWRVRHLLGTQ
jgi:hypothetical protein